MRRLSYRVQAGAIVTMNYRYYNATTQPLTKSTTTTKWFLPISLPAELAGRRPRSDPCHPNRPNLLFSLPHARLHGRWAVLKAACYGRYLLSGTKWPLSAAAHSMPLLLGAELPRRHSASGRRPTAFDHLIDQRSSEASWN